MGQTADQLRQEIDQKREDAGQKIGAIEAKVEGTVQQVKETVKETVDDTVEKAKGTVDETVQKVKESVDLLKQVEERPLAALGAALAGGFLLGRIVGGGQGDQQPSGHAAGARQSASGGGIRDAVKRSGLDDTFSTAMAAVMGMLTEKVRSAVDESFPAFAEKLKQQGGQTTPPRTAGNGPGAPVPIGSGSGLPPTPAGSPPSDSHVHD